MEREPVKIPVAMLRKAPWNYKEDDAALLKKLIANLERRGQIVTIVVRELEDGYFEVADGNHRVDAFNTLNYETVDAYNLGRVSEAEAKRAAVEVNETRFQTNPARFGELMADLIAEFELEPLASTLPFSVTDLEDISGLADFDWSKLGAGTDTAPGKTVSFTLDDEGWDLWVRWKGATEAPNNEARLVQLLKAGLQRIQMTE